MNTIYRRSPTPRAITVDGVQVVQVRLTKGPNGELHVYCEYTLKSGNRMVQTFHDDITGRLNALRITQALSTLDGIAQDSAAAELV